MKKIILIGVVLLALTIVALKPENKDVKSKFIEKNATVLAFGDSLTYGVGSHNKAYPMYLQILIKRNVINVGIPGEISKDGLQRLPVFLRTYNPNLVILCHGGNDIIRGLSKDKLIKNLKQMIHIIKKSGAQVLLVAVPNFNMFNFKTESLYKDLASEENILYEGHILEKIENDKTLKSDRIHPNTKGYELMAKSFYQILKEHNII